MCSREVRKTSDLNNKVRKSLEKTNRKLKTALAVITDVKEEHEVSRLEELDKEVEEIQGYLEKTNQKLDALITRSIGVKNDLQIARTAAVCSI